MNIDDTSLPYFSTIAHKALVYDYYTNDIVKIKYELYSYKFISGNVTTPLISKEPRNNECFYIRKITKTTDDEKLYFISNLNKIYIREYKLIEILDKIPNDEFETIPKWITQYKHFTKYLVYYDYKKNVHNKLDNNNNYKNYINDTHARTILVDDDITKYYTKLYEVKYCERFRKIDNIFNSIEGNNTCMVTTIYDEENLLYRYFVLFKKFLIDINKLPKELCTVTISQEEYENLMKLKSKLSKTPELRSVTISDS